VYDAVLYFCIVFTLRFVSTLSVSLRSISYRMAGIVQAEWLGLIGLVTVSLVEIFNCIVDLSGGDDARCRYHYCTWPDLREANKQLPRTSTTRGSSTKTVKNF